MIKISNRLYTLFGTLFVTLSIIGYPLATTLFLPIASDQLLSRTVTYPFRALLLLLAFFLIICTPRHVEKKKITSIVSLYVWFMIIYFVRILIDIFIRDVYLMPGYRSVVLQYLFLSMLPSIWATIKCARYVDFRQLNTWLLWGAVSLFILFLFNQSSLFAMEYDEMTRVNANVALGSIALGHTAVTIILILSYWLLIDKRPKNILTKVLIIIPILLTFVILLRAASRGPLVTLFIIILFYLYSITKFKIAGFLLSSFAIVVFYLNTSNIIHFLGSISPMMEQRITASLYENDSSGRDLLLDNALDLIAKNPILGEKFILDSGIYSHNSFIDVTMALGVFGGFVFAYIILCLFKITYNYLLKHSEKTIIAILAIQFFIKGCFSGAMYTDNSMCVCIVLIFGTSSYVPFLLRNERHI